ncbi:SCO2523 family variant P-loop protein [Nocardia sp. NPDC048505]|uniref:SCO2523 family variant P-loop protein n=1 Tax=unclassified Nocardia TaxID=2637762 RepID=UPI0033E099A5
MRHRGSAPVLVFATSAKGGTGRTVTSCNIAYRLCLNGYNVAYVDFDFGFPTAGAVFEIGQAAWGIDEGTGIHSYLLDQIGEPSRVDVTGYTDRAALRRTPRCSGRLMLFPGEVGGGEFIRCDDAMVTRATALLSSLLSEFDVVVVDLSVGRSVALELALAATASDALRHNSHRWLVFLRWTYQHVLAAGGLVYGPHGLVEAGIAWGHDPAALLASTRSVRTAVASSAPAFRDSGPEIAAWLEQQANALRQLAAAHRIGAAMLLGETPREPLLEWREQLILDHDVIARIASEATVTAYANLARRLTDPSTWDID